MFSRVLLVGATLCVFGVAQADSLFSVPTAENPGKHEIELALEQESEKTSFREAERTTTVQYGISERLAIGFDAKLNGKTRVEPNIALRLTPSKSPVEVGIGFQNVGVRSFSEQPYIVASHEEGSLSLHLGLTHDSNGKHGMIGVEKRFGSRFEILGDYIGGQGNFFTVGGQFTPVKNFHIEAGWMFANTRDERDGLFLSLERDIR